MTVIDVRNLRRSFGKKPVLKDVSLQVEEGSVYGLVGLNGAGKTTLIRMMLGLIRGNGGSADILGFNPWAHQPEFYKMTGVALESDGFFGNMSVRDNLEIFARAKGITPEQTGRYLEDYWGGTEIFKATKKVKYLSRGQRVQCGLCRAFLGWPRVCFFDEPAVSLDFLAYGHFKAMVRESQSRGAAAIISSHQLEVIDDLCDRVGLLRDGCLEEVPRQDGRKFSDEIKIIYKE